MNLLPTISSGKSGNREVAIALLMFWAFITGKVWFFTPPDDVKSYTEMWMHFTTATFLYTSAAFGFNYAVQQGLFNKTPPSPAHQTAPRPRSTDRDPDAGVQ